MKLKVDLSYANAQIVTLKENIEKKRDDQQTLRKTIVDLKKTLQKSKQPMDSLDECGIPANIDVLRTKK